MKMLNKTFKPITALTDNTDIQLKVAAHPRIYQLVHPNPTPHLEDLSKPLPRKREMSENEDTQTFIIIYNNIDVFPTLPYFLEAII